MYFWRRIDKVSHGGASSLDHNDECYFFMDRVAGGWDQSDANRKISNLKKPRERKGLPDWRYKEEAIQEFARDLAALIKELHLQTKTTIIVPIPPSQAPDDPAFDDRLERVAADVARQTGITWQALITTKKTHTASHAGGTRLLGDIASNLVLSDREGVVSKGELRTCILIDDVIVSGAHYVACKDLLCGLNPNLRIIGAFWAKQVPRSYDYEIITF